MATGPSGRSAASLRISFDGMDPRDRLVAVLL
jgi:hypothetical protein